MNVTHYQPMINSTYMTKQFGITQTFQASPESWGQMMKVLLQLSAIIIVYIYVAFERATTACYQAGYGLGQFIHGLNHDLTTVSMRYIFKFPTTTKSFTYLDPWQLKFNPIKFLIKPSSYLTVSMPPNVSGTKQRVDTSSDTKLTSQCMKKNQQWSTTTPATCVTVDPRKVVGIMNVDIQSEPTASSARSKRSAKQSTTTSKGCKTTTTKSTTTTAGKTSRSSTTRNTQGRTQRSARTTARTTTK